MILNAYSDNELVIKAAELNSAIDALTVSINGLQDGLKNVQAELDKRQLAAYFAAHPELVPVAVGDKLVVTEGVYRRKNDFTYPVGSVITIDRIDVFPDENEISVNVLGDLGVWFLDWDEVDSMRRAWLASQQETK